MPRSIPTLLLTSKRVYVGFLRQVFLVGFESEGDEPLASSLLFDRDFLDGRFVRYVAVVANRDVTDFGEPECRTSATRVFEFEAVIRNLRFLISHQT